MKNETVVSYLPMSHVASHIFDGYIIPCCGGTTFIADKDALKGTLVRNKKYCEKIPYIIPSDISTCSEVDMYLFETH